ncbi:hypothetical protein AM231_00735 [Paenibacillus solani]|uniref:Uncharacterized protein n=2 Tax=Paenibacillus solani TaxID=1705565 RepID=A0A0M1P016_9BACL|nr:hypothetical protein AM231_00735 [Paenibacillus solani]
MREDATVYALYSMARKIGQAIDGGIGGFAIAAVGYNSESRSRQMRRCMVSSLWEPWCLP